MDDTSKVWRSQLDWEEERHAYQTKRLPKIKDKMARKYSEFEELCLAKDSYQCMESYDTLMHTIQWAHKKFHEAWERCEWIIQDSGEKIADLEQRLLSTASS